MNYRVIFFHKHPTSAKTVFLKFSYESVCAFETLGKLAQLTDEDLQTPRLHPAQVIAEIENRLGFTADILDAQAEFQQLVDVPGGPVQVLLFAFSTYDPPFALAETAGADFIDLTQARGLPDVELELLRKVYEFVLGG